MSKTTKAPDVAISRAAALRATKAGGEAARAGVAVKDCPHAGDTTENRFLRSFWTKGYAIAKPATPA